jgi:hypothetical protein
LFVFYIFCKNCQLKDLLLIFANKHGRRGVFRLSKEEVARRKKNKEKLSAARKTAQIKKIEKKKLLLEEALNKAK